MIRSLLHLAQASAWMVVGRSSGLVWTLLITAILDIDSLGRYATAFALAALISAPLENVFVVRSVRVPDAEFVAERATRALLGAAMAIVGLVLIAPVFVVGMALVVAGGEMLFNVVKSGHVRDGHPRLVMRMDAFRQISSILLGTAFLLLVPDPSLEGAVACYLAPYVVVALLAARVARGARPQFPGTWRENAVYLWDAAVIALYLQGDILVLGLLAGDDVVGIYSIASQLALAASIVGQLYGQGFTPALRDAKGDLAAGPPAKVTAAIGLLIGVGAVAIAVVLLVATDYHAVAWALLALAPFACMRTIDNVLTVVLYAQGRDVPRVAWGGIALTVRLALLVGLVVGLAGVLAAPVAVGIAAVVGETIMLAAFLRLARRPLPRQARA